ncbi:hypothetical protein L1887_00921 [Cichorium endivia]|nr:hypothetical protein L1887_00921 [Cichorium endivia]
MLTNILTFMEVTGFDTPKLAVTKIPIHVIPKYPTLKPNLLDEEYEGMVELEDACMGEEDDFALVEDVQEITIYDEWEENLMNRENIKRKEY